MSKYYQQGDVLLKRVDQLPQGAVELPQVDRILQRGETTGHKHQFLGNTALKVYVDEASAPADPAQVLRITEVGGRRFIEVVESPALLSHEEHGPISVEPGLYELDIVREWDYFEGVLRQVAD